MAIERTLSIIKPDAVAKNVIGQIYARFEGAGLKVVAAKMAHLSRGEAEAFYAVHKARPFFNDLVSFMISGPVVVQVLEGEGAIAKNREVMGATDPAAAAAGTGLATFSAPAGGGSTLVTSNAAPEICPACSAGPTAASSTKPPRPVLISSGLRAMAANSAAPIMCRVSGSSGQCSVITSDSASIRSNGV